jgi:thiamine transport system ATP-binding protein
VSEVALADLLVAFDGVPALDGVSLSVAEGEFFTLVGPSGCGKTTTLRSIAGFEEPDAGRVTIGGEPMAGVPPEKRNVGVVFQNYALFPHMTVAENVAYGLRFRDPPGGGTTDERVTELLELVDMAGMGDRDPESLSGGQQQRVALARALAPGPDVLLLDEPLSALDARLRERLRVTVRELQQELSITTVYVTHDQAEALAISDRVAVMHDGAIEQVGAPEAVYRDPETRFVAEFVGDNNLLDGSVEGTNPPRVAVDGTTIELTGLDGDRSLAAGSSVLLSIRPEAFVLDPDRERATTLSATVETVEFLGDAYRLHCDWQGRTLLVKAGGERPPAGEIALGIDPETVTVVQNGGDV